MGQPTMHPSERPKANVPAAGQKPSALACPDVRVVSLRALLVSTQLGDPAVEFPHDTVRLEVTVENAGKKDVPSLFIVDVIAYRNGVRVGGLGCPSCLGAPGSRFVMSEIKDTFPHGVKTVYSVEVPPLYNECTTANNKASLTIDEAQLHPGVRIQVPRPR